MSKKLLSLTVFIAAIAFVVVAALIVMKNFEIDFFKTKTSVTSYTIIEQIKLVAKLQTVEYYGATTVKWEKVDWAKAQSQVLFLGKEKSSRISIWRGWGLKYQRKATTKLLC